MSRVFISGFFLILSILAAGCSSANDKITIDQLQDVPAQGDHTALIPEGSTKGFLAPDFAIETIDGNKVSLSQLASEKPVLLYFWATWCPYCKADLAIASKIYPEYKDKVAFLAVDLDPKETVQQIARYKEDGGHSFIDFAAADTKVLDAYGITSTTTKLAIGRNRLILWRGSGVVDEKTWRILFEGLASS